MSPFTRGELKRRGYDVEVVERTYSPITAIMVDHEHGALQGVAGNTGDDYGIAW